MNLNFGEKDEPIINWSEEHTYTPKDLEIMGHYRTVVTSTSIKYGWVPYYMIQNYNIPFKQELSLERVINDIRTFYNILSGQIECDLIADTKSKTIKLYRLKLFIYKDQLPDDYLRVTVILEKIKRVIVQYLYGQQLGVWDGTYAYTIIFACEE